MKVENQSIAMQERYLKLMKHRYPTVFVEMQHPKKIASGFKIVKAFVLWVVDNYVWAIYISAQVTSPKAQLTEICSKLLSPTLPELVVFQAPDHKFYTHSNLYVIMCPKE